MFDFAKESSAIFNEILPLAQMHSQELDYDLTKDDPLDINEAAYRGIDEMGFLRVFTVRDKSLLIGYAVFVVAPSLDRKTMTQAQESGLFIHPEYRGTAVFRLLKFCDASLAEEGVDMVLYHAPAKRSNFGELLSKRGYVKVDEVYARRL